MIALKSTSRYRYSWAQAVTVISETYIFVRNAFLVTLVSGTVYKSKSIVAD